MRATEKVSGNQRVASCTSVGGQRARRSYQAPSLLKGPVLSAVTAQDGTAVSGELF
jgi:hypothetical protein